MTEKPGCLFCGAAGPMTKEHIIPRWLAKLTARRGGPVTQSRASYTQPVPHVRSYPVVGIKLPGVCLGCNGGWMKGLEDAVKPLLTPMIGGQRIQLSPADQRVLATWLYKMCLLLRYDDRPPETPPLEWRRWLYVKREPPPSSQAWLAVYGGDWRRPWWTRRHGLIVQTIEEETGQLLHESNGYLTTIQIGAVGLQMVVWGTLPIEGKPFADERHLLRIWPPTDDTLSWPTPFAFDAEWMDRWATQWLTTPPPPLGI